jgi:hypothetical protein
MNQEDFDEYIRQVEPSARQSAADWQTAIGLQQVDGLKPSQYLLDVAQRNIAGDITKKEWVLRGDTVHYLNWEDLSRAIDYDIQQEREFSYRNCTDDEKVSHICRFVSGLWQIHPFCEGNTRATAVFTIQYLRSMGYDVTNDLFKDHSWYFRNALVRANYKNVRLSIDYDISFLERFFRNLLLDEKNELKNRSMLINAPDGWNATDDKPTITDDKPTITDNQPTITDDNRR